MNPSIVILILSAAFFVFMSITSFILQLLICLIASVSGFRITEFSYLFWSIKWIDDTGLGNMKYKLFTRRFTCVAQGLFGKYGEENRDREKEDTASVLIYGITGAIVCICAVVSYVAVSALERSLTIRLLRILFFTFAMWGVLFVYSAIKGRSIEKDPLRRKMRECYLQMRAASDMNEIDCPPLEDVKGPKAPLISSEILYQLLRYRILEGKEDKEELQKIAAWLDIRVGSVNISDINFSINSALMMYYSYWQLDPQKATKCYEDSKNRIESDLDCNGRRKLAYYHYYVLNDVEGAERILKEGLEALNTKSVMFSKCEIEAERKYLLRLEEQIRNGQ
jgi:hypothetical protein